MTMTMMMTMMMMMMMMRMMVLLELSYGNFPCILVNALIFTASKEYRFCLLKMNHKCPPQKSNSLLLL